MAIRTLQFRCKPAATGLPAPGWLDLVDGETIGPKISNAGGTEISVSVTQKFSKSTTSGNKATATQAAAHGWPENVLDNWWECRAVDGDTGVIEISGFAPDQSVTIWANGYDSAGRHANFRSPALTGELVQYLNTGEINPETEEVIIPPPVRIDATADGSGRVTLSLEVVSITAGLQGFIVEFDDEGGSPSPTKTKKLKLSGATAVKQIDGSGAAVNVTHTYDHGILYSGDPLALSDETRPTVLATFADVAVVDGECKLTDSDCLTGSIDALPVGASTRYLVLKDTDSATGKFLIYPNVTITEE